jgi:excisionase family DNA binding protein
VAKEQRHGSHGPLLTAAEVAEQLHMSLRSVRRMIRDGRLPIARFGRAVRIRPEALEKLIAASE